MSEGSTRVSVRILEKEYQINCPAEERSALLDSAEFLNARMREIRDSGKVVGLDRIAVIAALNIANELLRGRRTDTTVDSEIGGRLRILRERVESALEKGQQLEF
ncbi:MAG: cell division protein ZapA [Gammaproteobacteria bacterium]|nr:cell division protein ZapA [Gammaproteobacteria bacterium]